MQKYINILHAIYNNLNNPLKVQEVAEKISNYQCKK